jgi:hypothetical protein
LATEPGLDIVGAMAMTFDESAWPILVISYPRHFTYDDVDKHLMVILSHVERREQFAVVFDLRGTRVFTSTERQLLWAFIKTHRLLLERYCFSIVIVTGDRLHRGIVNALTWLVRMPCVVKTYPTMAAGRAWLRGVRPH